MQWMEQLWIIPADDAVNRYGDEDSDGNLNDITTDFNQNYDTHPGLMKWHRTGYMERDIVDYNTKI